MLAAFKYETHYTCNAGENLITPSDLKQLLSLEQRIIYMSFKINLLNQDNTLCRTFRVALTASELKVILRDITSAAPLNLPNGFWNKNSKRYPRNFTLSHWSRLSRFAGRLCHEICKLSPSYFTPAHWNMPTSSAEVSGLLPRDFLWLFSYWKSN